ncbi:MAG: Uma2 family endonuclease [Planctomycetes bacterium]|nr:Uma2 family endonuclease [Planctomycetota bacterium]
MTIVIHDTLVEERLRAERAASGADRHDEVWENVYMMAPMPNHEHQVLVGRFTRVLDEIVSDAGAGDVVPGVNVSDRVANWETNFRVPDVAVFLTTTRAVNHDQFWCGGPDFVVEIVSPHDQTREKLGFYGAIKTRELLVVDRDPWRLELYRHDGHSLPLVATGGMPDEDWIESSVLGVRQRLQHGADRPRIDVWHPASERHWRI